MRYSRRCSISLLVVGVTGLLFASGCNPPKQTQSAKSELNAGYAALDAKQYDQAISTADAFLQRTPAGEGTAEALYLRGRALEQKPAGTPAEANSNLMAAQSAYKDALHRSPSPRLEAYIHASLGNVNYFLEDYANAAIEWTSAYNKLDDDNTKAWVLYRIGVSKQRLEQFAEADRYFTTVQQQYPNSVPAERAQEHIGARGFTVQFVTLSSEAAADDAISAFRKDGVLAGKRTDQKGRSVVSVGPIASLQQAKSLKSRYATKYPDAMIIP